MPWTTPETFTAGQTLTAASMNAISGNLTELRNTPSSLNAQSNDTETGGGSADFTYSAAEVTLTPGTWIVQGGASVIMASGTDTVSVSLWNQTTGAEVSNSIGAKALSSTTSDVSMFSRLTLITVTSSTAIRVRIRRNGTSTVRASSAAGAPAAFLNAYRVQTA